MNSKSGFATTNYTKIIAIITAVIIAFIVYLVVSFIDKDDDSSVEGLEEGIAYIQDFSVNYTTESESPNGDIDGNSMSASKTSSWQKCYIVIDFGMRMATDNTSGETITAQCTVSDADVINCRVDSAETSSTYVSTKNNVTTITATYTLPSKAGNLVSERLVISLTPDAVGEAEIGYGFTCKTKTPYASSVIDGSVVVTQNEISLQNASPLEYSVNSDFSGYEVVSLVSSQYTDIEIKSQINGIPVTAVADNAFYGKSKVISVTIPSSVTTIGAYAFYKCTALTSVDLPNGLTSIGEYAFSGCSALASVTIPDKVTSLGEYIFDNCTALAYISLGNGLTSIGEYAFNKCTSLTSVTIPYYVSSIGKHAFSGCSSLSSVTFENALGWYYTFIVKCEIDVTDASANAKNLTNSWGVYIEYTWHRDD